MSHILKAPNSASPVRARAPSLPSAQARCTPPPPAPRQAPQARRVERRAGQWAAKSAERPRPLPTVGLAAHPRPQAGLRRRERLCWDLKKQQSVRLWRRGPEPSRVPRAGETLGREAECRAEERGSQGGQGPGREGGAPGRRSGRREACLPEDRREPPQTRGGVAVRTRGRRVLTAPAASREKWTRGMGGASGKKWGARC